MPCSSTGGSGWNLLRKSAHHALIQTRETRYTKQIGLGTLAVYGIGQQGFTHPRLGTIKRIVRVAPDSLYVEIKQLARFAAMVSIASIARGGLFAKLEAREEFKNALRRQGVKRWMPIRESVCE